jgi:indole-3-glycerol phosphate synthase
MARFAQAISEGDGISVIPLLEGDVARLAAEADAAGAEGIAVWRQADAEAARAQTGLPILVREPELDVSEDLRFFRPPHADGCILFYADWAGSDELEHVHERLAVDGVDCALGVRDEEELEQALVRVDPEIVLICRRSVAHDDEELELVLDLLPDVPAGKLVIAESGVIAREQVVALQRAGVDAVVVQGLAEGGGFSRAIEELAGSVQPGR